jgi:hypothetical protein
MTAETDPSKRDRTPNAPADHDGDNEIGFRNVDEEADMNTRPEIHSASTAGHA